MKIQQAFKFQLRVKPDQDSILRRFAGCCRFVWNHALELEKTLYEQEGKHLGYAKLCSMLGELKNSHDTEFLRDAPAQILQQTLKDLDRAYRNFFEKRAEFPRFKKKGMHDAFRYPQHFKLDENNGRIFLPKIGWVRYRNSRRTEGTVKQVTVSLSAGKWYVSIQTEREVPNPCHPSSSEVGIDMGIVSFATLSDGTSIPPLNSFRKYERKLARLQRSLSRKTKFSANWRKTKKSISRLHRKIADCRSDFLHKVSTDISKNHAVVVMEDLKVRNMSRSASGTVENPGRNVRAKSGLNKAILDQAWYEFRRQLAYKLEWRGGILITVSPQNTSRQCSRCGYVDAGNRKKQAVFHCLACGHEMNADLNAAINIRAAGHAVSACGAGRAHAPAVKQEPARDTAA